jgi:hypothetical protein
VRDSLGVPRTLEVVAVVKGVERAQAKRSQESSFAGNTRRVGSVENESNIEGDERGERWETRGSLMRLSS